MLIILWLHWINKKKFLHLCQLMTLQIAELRYYATNEQLKHSSKKRALSWDIVNCFQNKSFSKKIVITKVQVLTKNICTWITLERGKNLCCSSDTNSAVKKRYIICLLLVLRLVMASEIQAMCIDTCFSHFIIMRKL